MRNLDSQALALLSGEREIEPVAIISVEWNAGSAPLWYADRIVMDPNSPTTVLYDGRILELGDLDESQRSDSSGLSGALSITLDDRDGALKSIFNANDVHLKKVNVYQWFLGLQDSDKFLIFSGQVSTPLIWDEGKRTLTFDVVTKLEDQEVGWSAELGNYSSIAQELIGTPWPLVFGTVQHVPALQLQNIPTAFTTEPFGLLDDTLNTQLASLQNLLQEAILATQYFSLQVANGGGDTEDIMHDSNVKQYVQMQADIQDQITLIKMTSGWQGQFVKSSVPLIPTVFVTQPFSGLVRVGNSLFKATINGQGGSLSTIPQLLPGAPGAQDVRQGFQFFNAGSQVVIADNYPIQFVASITPGTVLKVWAMRSFNGLQRLAVVPPSYYTISSQAMGNGLVATYVTLKKPLSTVAMLDNLKTQVWENDFGKSLPPHIVNQIDWEDKLYVTFASSIGPNPVDIIVWLITHYTSNGYDADSFSAVHASLAGFPMNFMLAEMPNVLDLLTEIAYQARCLIFLRDDVFYLLFLPRLGDPVDTLTEDDISVGSLQVTTTPTEGLITKYVASYRPDYSPFFDKQVRVILRYNIPKYGTHEESHDFYTYNNFYSTEKGATFWLIRKSQTWKVLKAKLLLTKINLEAFDYVTLHFARPYVADGDVVGLITNAKYNSADKTIDVEIWTGVLLGEMAQNPFAFPAGATEQDVWPQVHAQAAGSGGGISSPSLPAANSNRTPVGAVIDGFHLIQGYNDGGGGLEDRPNWSSGDPIPGGGFTAQIIPQPADQVFPHTPLPVADPTLDYSYKTPPDPTLVKKDGMYPGFVGAKIGQDKTNKNLVNYKVRVFEDGLLNNPKEIVVGQLQIDLDDTIPPGSWTYISYRQGVDQDGNNYTEHTMQIPVWLS